MSGIAASVMFFLVIEERAKHYEGYSKAVDHESELVKLDLDDFLKRYNEVNAHAAMSNLIKYVEDIPTYVREYTENDISALPPN